MGRYINFYIANGAGTPVEKTRQFQGTLENVNVQNVPGVGHMSIEKNQIMQQKVISEIDAVVFGRSMGQEARQPAAADAVRHGAASLRRYATNRLGSITLAGARAANSANSSAIDHPRASGRWPPPALCGRRAVRRKSQAESA